MSDVALHVDLFNLVNMVGFSATCIALIYWWCLFITILRGEYMPLGNDWLNAVFMSIVSVSWFVYG